jgi:Fibronectin type III domain
MALLLLLNSFYISSFFKFLIMTMDVSVAYRRLPIVKVNSFASSVGELMTNDLRFAPFAPEVALLKASNTAFTVSIAVANRGSEAQKAACQACKVATIEALDVLAFAVNAFSKGDEQIIKAAGFDTKKAAKSINEVPTPTNVTAKNDDRSGEASAKWKGNTAAVSYNVFYRAEGETDYKIGTHATACSAVLKGLTPKTYYDICIQAVGRKGLISEMTDPVTVLVS